MGTHTRSARSLLQRRPHRLRPVPTPRVLTQPELNRALLARQLLLERTRIPIPRALERMCGLQDQYAPSGYIGLWTRLAGFERDDLTRALERRAVDPGDPDARHDPPRVAPRLLALRPRDRRAAARVVVPRDQAHATNGDASARSIRAAAACSPTAHCARRRSSRRSASRRATSSASGSGRSWSASRRREPGSSAARISTASPSSGSVRRRATAEQGRDLLVRRYLAAFGPASRADIATFTGLPLTTLDGVLRRLPLREVPDRRGRAAPRRPWRPAPTAGHGGAGALPPDLGRDAARPRAADPDPARAVPARRSSTRRCRSRSARSSSTDRSPARGVSMTAASRRHPSNRSRRPRGARLSPKPRPRRVPSPNAMPVEPKPASPR